MKYTNNLLKRWRYHFDCYSDNYVKVYIRISKLTSMHEMMFLKVCELCEAFGANVALEGPLAGVCPQVHLEIR